MKINLEFLQAKGACREAVEEFKERWCKEVTPVYAIGRLIKEDKLEWANWLIVRCMEYKQYVAYKKAAYAVADAAAKKEMQLKILKYGIKLLKK